MHDAILVQMTRKQWRRIRETLELTPKELAHELGVDYSSVTRYESGAVKIPKSRAKALKLLQRAMDAAA